jgi:WD40 repeat protein
VGLVDDLLADDAYLLHADLRRLIMAADGASSPAARDRARLIRITPEAATAVPAERVAQFSVTETLDNLGTTYRDDRWQVPYRARWAVVRPRTERVSFNHQDAVHAICAVMVDGQNLLATASDDCTVRLWDPRTGEQLSTFGERSFLFCEMCAVTVDGQNLLATNDYDRTVTTNAYGGTVRLWDPRTGEQLTVLEAYISGLCAVTVDGRELLATIDKVGGPVRLWDPRTGEQVSTFGERSSLCAVCAVTVDGRELLATGGEYDRWARLWDPHTGEQLAAVDGGSRGVRTGSRGVREVCAVTVDGQTLLATCGHDSWVRLWNPRTGDQIAELNERPEGVGAMCAVTVDGQSLLATGGTAGTVRIWDPRTGTHLTTLGGPRSGRHGNFDDSIHAMCAVTVDGQSQLATGSADGTVRLWDPQESERPAASDGHYHEVNAMCTVTVDGRELLATAGGAVRLRDPHTGEQLSEFSDHLHGTHAVCAVTVEGRNLLATRDWDGWVHLRDPGNGEYLSVFAIPGSTAMCAVTVDGLNLLVTGGDYGGAVRLWDPLISDRLADKRLWNPHISKPLAYVWRCLLRVFRVRRRVPLWPQHISKPVAVLGEGRAVCAVTVDGQDLLATGGRDGTLRIWNPRTGKELIAFGDRKGKIHAVCAIMVDGQNLLATGSDDGLVQLWDPRTRRCLVTIPAHHPVSAVAAVGDSLAIALSFGILVIELNIAAQPTFDLGAKNADRPAPANTSFAGP